MNPNIFPNQLRILNQILSEYQGEIPLANFLKTTFSENKNFGSKDRKLYREICFSYFRNCGYLSATSVADWLKKYADSIENIKIDYDIFSQFIVEKGFQFSNGLSPEKYYAWFQQKAPVFYINCNKKIELELQQNNNFLTRINGNCFVFNPETNLDMYVEKGNGWIMDLSSQAAANQIEIKANEKVWDCCSGAGGKSIYLLHKFGHFDLYCTDIRKHILLELKNRMLHLGLPIPKVNCVDLTKEIPFENEYFDTIICDAPCSGSGTWRRNPEQLKFTKKQQIIQYQQIQINIVKNAFKKLKVGGNLYYITCSIFKEENEIVLENLQLSNVQIIKQQLVKSENLLGDFLFVSVLKKISE